MWGLGLNGIQLKWIIGTHSNWKIKILGAVLDLPAKKALPIQPIWPIFLVNGLDWKCCFAGSSKMAWRILIFFQLQLVPIIHLSWIPLRPKPPTFLGHSKAGHGYVSYKDNSDDADVIFACMCGMPSPTVWVCPILVMGSVMGKLFYCCGPHYEMGVADSVGPRSTNWDTEFKRTFLLQGVS